jgi:5-methylcytosine-specific restriction endonuclease McrA
MAKGYLWYKLIGTSFGKNCTILAHSHTEIMKNGKPRQYFEVQCHCGVKWVIPNNTILRINECWKCAHKARGLKIRGKNHPKYNPNLTDEVRFSNRRHSVNRENYRHIYERDKYTCQKCFCKSRKLVVHHIDCWANFPEKRQDPDNLITLCNDCHTEFHIMFGYGNNTREQFQKFKN